MPTNERVTHLNVGAVSRSVGLTKPSHVSQLRKVHNGRWIALIIGLLVLGLSACDLAPAMPTLTATRSVTPSPTQTLTMTLTPTITLTPSRTLVPTQTPTPTIPYHYTGPLVRLAWFYKPSPRADWPFVADHFDFFILTHQDESERDGLREHGVTAPILQYLRFDAIHDPGACALRSNCNQVAFAPGDFCDISQTHPDWFLLDSNGQRLADDDGDYYMDPGHPGWRAFWLERARQLQTDYGWKGVFLDNVDASLAKHSQLQNYPDEAGYQAAVAGFLDYVSVNYFQPEGRPLYANIIGVRDEAVWFRYLDFLDGVFVEDFAVSWTDYYGWAVWEAQLIRVERAAALGKPVILVGQGPVADAQRQTFTLASYLLISNGQMLFRYTLNDHYDEPWWYDNYATTLGDPLGPRYAVSGVWYRDFTGGQVMVNPVKLTASITTR